MTDALIERPLIANHEGEYLLSLVWPDGYFADMLDPEFTEYLKVTPAHKAFWQLICETESPETPEQYLEEFVPSYAHYGKREFPSGTLHCGWYFEHNVRIYLMITELDGSVRYCLVNDDAKNDEWMFLQVDETKNLKA